MRFGPKPHQTIDPQTAELVLTLLAARQPAVFGRLLSEVMLGPEAVKTRGRPPA